MFRPYCEHVTQDQSPFSWISRIVFFVPHPEWFRRMKTHIAGKTDEEISPALRLCGLQERLLDLANYLVSKTVTAPAMLTSADWFTSHRTGIFLAYSAFHGHGRNDILSRALRTPHITPTALSAWLAKKPPGLDVKAILSISCAALIPVAPMAGMMDVQTQLHFDYWQQSF
ncbi:hypothetical protein SNOG_08307 [Parastagonospora nodorum SN15]|uniref:Uncharacterized protein n=1 Tax=Phaeosphaeria nodorum (strain SN15 / ATCC MYA-4574 / FGSC 10173) TaxID=321614 RepID=Q0UIV7_PHANO|nr:hypothetical protein SNOG_08307 [Parastagonospora nodorum SN15]EAT84583.1 hypothetical protein SNOG_08307 [Parastagonospora nodorum SN15]